MDDEALLSLLAESLADDTAPADSIEVAYAAFGWRTLDADLAQLIEDSQVEVVGFRQAAYSRVVSYDTDHGSVEVAIDNDTFELVIAPAPTAVILRQVATSQELAVDDLGRATASGVSGSIRFEITWADGSAQTPWLTI